MFVVCCPVQKTRNLSKRLEIQNFTKQLIFWQHFSTYFGGIFFQIFPNIFMKFYSLEFQFSNSSLRLFFPLIKFVTT